jgi:hypothetical protein
VLYNNGDGLNPLTYQAPNTISGTVKRADGNPVANATVVAVSQTGVYSVVGNTISGTDGTYSIAIGQRTGTFSVYAYNATYTDIKSWVVVS